MLSHWYILLDLRNTFSFGLCCLYFHSHSPWFFHIPLCQGHYLFMKLHIYDTLLVSHAMYIKYTYILKGHGGLNVFEFAYLFSIVTYLLQFEIKAWKKAYWYYKIFCFGSQKVKTGPSSVTVSLAHISVPLVFSSLFQKWSELNKKCIT